MSHIACRQKIVLMATIAIWTVICAIMVAAFRMFTVRVVVASSNFKPDNELSEYTVPFRLSFVSRSAFDLLNPTFLVGSKKSNKCTALIADGLGTPQDELLRSDSRSLPPFEYWSKLTVTRFLLENILGRICIYMWYTHMCQCESTWKRAGDGRCVAVFRFAVKVDSINWLFVFIKFELLYLVLKPLRISSDGSIPFSSDVPAQNSVYMRVVWDLDYSAECP